MTARTLQWFPVPDITSEFGSLSYSFGGGTVSVTMHGERNLSLSFGGVIALRFEEECPGFDPLPNPLPMLKPQVTFPLLIIEDSEWLGMFEPIYRGRKHFAFITSDHLLQLIAKPEVVAKWLAP